MGKKSNLTPEKLMPLPWDKESKPAEREPVKKVELTREQTNARVRELLARGI